MKNYKIHTLDLHFQNHDETIAAFLIESENGLALVESGPHSTFEALKKAVANLGFRIEDIHHVFLTHIHFDHAGAAWCLASHATIYVHPLGEKHLLDPTKLYNSAKQIYQDKMDTLWGDMKAIPTKKLHVAAHGEVIVVGDLRFTAWHTPGHASHHIAWQLESELFTGDVAGVRIDGGVVVPPCPPPDIDVEAWQMSIELMLNLNLEALYLTHFGREENVTATLNELESRLLNWANWIKPFAQSGQNAADVTPQYQAMVKAKLATFGIVGKHYEQYETANPSWMSVAGLLRYWFKKG